MLKLELIIRNTTCVEVPTQKSREYVTRHEIFGPAALSSFFRNGGETKIIKLRLESRIKSQAISANQMLEI
jgi:hypothetical protein